MALKMFVLKPGIQQNKDKKPNQVVAIVSFLIIPFNKRLKIHFDYTHHS